MLKLRFKNNKLNAVWLVEPKVTVGRAASNDLVVDDPGCADTHAEIQVRHESLTLVNVSDGKTLFVNRKPVESSVPLKINDQLILGKTILEVVDPKLERPAAPKASAPPASPAKTGWALKANSAALSNRVFTLGGETVIGRSNECDITLAAAHLSRRHVKLTVQDGILYVRDLGSANGTYLNGEKITEARVRRGDELCFDTLSFGVIGPSQDLDRTTVRPAAPKQESAATARPAGKVRNRTVVNVDMNEDPEDDMTGLSSFSDPDFPPEQEQEKPKSRVGLLFGLLVLAAVAVGIAHHLGYIAF